MLKKKYGAKEVWCEMKYNGAKGNMVLNKYSTIRNMVYTKRSIYGAKKVWCKRRSKVLKEVWC